MTSLVDEGCTTVEGFLLVLPDFTLIVLGAILARWVMVQPEFWSGVERLVYYVLFPAMLFRSLANAPTLGAGALALLGAAAVTVLAGFALGWMIRRAIDPNPVRAASQIQCAYRFNTYMGMALAGQLAGASGSALMGAVCGTMVPLVNVLAVGSMSRGGVRATLRALGTNPLVLATLAGAAYHLAGLPLPAAMDTLLGRLGAAAVAMGLIGVGAALRIDRSLLRPASWGIVAIKLLALPAIAWGIATWWGIEGLAREMLILFAALPSASSAYILASRLGGDAPAVARLISLTTLGSALTLGGILSLLR
ncbi:AEC family transporter [Tepidiphilus olei]|uniref:AEC family transporter n=1 Tax=Tepidiphilus olei TaxID=2502184 RepID=UPI001C8F8A83|nr:AEC family transporter [Tepidiphilus olei]